MKFERIPKSNADAMWPWIKDIDSFYRFTDEFNIVGVSWSKPIMLSASYFLRLLEEGSSARAHFARNAYGGDDEHSSDLSKYYDHLFDHGSFWRCKDGSVICMTMPYARTEEIIQDTFQEMIHKFDFPETIKMDIIGSEYGVGYKFRPNGNFMVLIYCDLSREQYNPYLSEEELRQKAIQHSREGVRHSSQTNNYVRDRYVREYAKVRAHGHCQLCGKKAPFNKPDGTPFLETHHVICLSEGGEDSIYNTVALCPNCHRKMHELDLPEDVEKLKRVAMEVE